MPISKHWHSTGCPHNLHLAVQTMIQDQTVPSLHLMPEHTAWQLCSSAKLSPVAEAFWATAPLHSYHSLKSTTKFSKVYLGGLTENTT